MRLPNFAWLSENIEIFLSNHFFGYYDGTKRSSFSVVIIQRERERERDEAI